jgi:tRNA(fMet)-specific endonuclease VapC
VTRYLLDTNVLSELLRKRPDAALLEHVRAVRRAELATSAVCVMELRYGAALHANGAALWARIQTDLLHRLRVLPLSDAAAVRAGDVLASLRKRGTPIGLEDVLIGATALEAGLVVSTRNISHFERIEGLTVESWFAPPS